VLPTPPSYFRGEWGFRKGKREGKGKKKRGLRGRKERGSLEEGKGKGEEGRGEIGEKEEKGREKGGERRMCAALNFSEALASS